MQKVWLGVYIITALISVVFIVKSARNLDTTGKAVLMDWKVVEKDSSSFALLVSYKFLDEGKEVEGAIELAKPYFFNVPSAINAIETLSKKDWDVFYRKADPKKNSLQKFFPFKSCIQAILTLGVLVYFVVLRKMVRRFSV